MQTFAGLALSAQRSSARPLPAGLPSMPLPAWWRCCSWARRTGEGRRRTSLPCWQPGLPSSAGSAMSQTQIRTLRIPCTAASLPPAAAPQRVLHWCPCLAAPSLWQDTQLWAVAVLVLLVARILPGLPLPGPRVVRRWGAPSQGREHPPEAAVVPASIPGVAFSSTLVWKVATLIGALRRFALENIFLRV